MTSLSTAPTDSLDASPGISTWELDPVHSHVEFAVRHLMISTVRGRFAECRARSGWTRPTPARFSWTPRSAPRASTRGRRSAMRTSAPRISSMWRGSQRFSSAAGVFRGTRSKAIPADRRPHHPRHHARGDAGRLGRGSRDGPVGGRACGFSAHTTIDRTDFGVTWNQALEAGGVLVGNRSRISIEVELVRQAQRAAA